MDFLAAAGCAGCFPAVFRPVGDTPHSAGAVSRRVADADRRRLMYAKAIPGPLPFDRQLPRWEHTAQLGALLGVIGPNRLHTLKPVHPLPIEQPPIR